MIRISIKTPEEEFDFEIEIEQNLSVFDLKKKIMQVYPNNPSISSQKLIYEGRTLKNENYLYQIFNLSKETKNLIIFLFFNKKKEETNLQLEQNEQFNLYYIFKI
ncbi:homocysteine-induced endoplasmic reticulum protein isoform a [Anaeramoeba ignava]|uniref:Homocysteine-induced endoplasmic reticulum protein isoform a n=1 Tax=Anaeramoeba ignava TaxID=1746090 RepID=A0A9Q0L4N8_ANAIG|nr:homocysteine-induced endoplasmic reticulum protein isoform a [Anaeramoeba ignava]